MSARVLAIGALGLAAVLAAPNLGAQDLSRYRNFQFGSTLAAVSGLSGIAPSAAVVIHQRPALLQDLEWRLSRWGSGSALPSTDPVERILFSFCDDQLFRIVVDYGHEQTEGLTDSDMVEAISATYGMPLKKTAAGRATSGVESESGSVIARWGDAAHTAVLYRTSSYGADFQLTLIDVHLAGLAKTAEAQAVRLDAQEAPRREIERQKKERDDELAAEAKARAANKSAFRP